MDAGRRAANLKPGRAWGGAGTSTKHANTGCRKDFFEKNSRWHDLCWVALRENQGSEGPANRRDRPGCRWGDSGGRLRAHMCDKMAHVRQVVSNVRHYVSPTGPPPRPFRPGSAAHKPSCEGINKLESVGSPHVTYEEGFPTTRKPRKDASGSTRARSDHAPRPSPAGRPWFKVRGPVGFFRPEKTSNSEKQPIFHVIKKDSSCLSLCNAETYKKDGEIVQVALVGVDI